VPCCAQTSVENEKEPFYETGWFESILAIGSLLGVGLCGVCGVCKKAWNFFCVSTRASIGRSYSDGQGAFGANDTAAGGDGVESSVGGVPDRPDVETSALVASPTTQAEAGGGDNGQGGASS